MSLNRFSNKEEILDKRGLSKGILWKKDILKFLNLEQLPITPSFISTIELHLYSPNGEKLLTSIDVSENNYQLDGDKIYIDYVEELTQVNIQRGYFRVVVNIHNDILGSSNLPLMTIKDISDDRREMLLVIRPDIEDLDLSAREQMIKEYFDEYTNAYDADLGLNFGSNNIFKIINHKEWTNESDIVLRLYEPLPEEYNLNDTCWIVKQLADSFIDEININLSPVEIQPNILRGPDFEINTQYTTITETDFKTWNSLLDSNLSTSQKIINSYFSGSLSGIDLGIDYTGFQNFINYSSANERLSNFIYKKQLVEYYDQQISILTGTSGSSTTTLANNINKFRERKDSIIGDFDKFEYWLLNEPTSSLTTHGIEGGFIGAQHYVIRPYPKYLKNGVYVNHHSTSSIATNWYNNLSATASLYDEQNDTALIKTIPEHIRLDANNSEYELFVNMIGQHFDILWTYVDGLSKTYKLEEQPKLSIDKSILPDIAKSLGWELTNGKQASQLWQYRLGTNSIGLFAQSGSIFTESDEQITHEVWRRIVNNLPYLLKTKGTGRSIKALMNMYGIPQTLLSIREYGGPKVGEDVPALIEDRFSYAINFDSGSNINYSSNHISSSMNDWGIEKGVIPPITREFRFRPYTKQNMMLYSQNASGGSAQVAIAVEHTGSYSGSNEYGRLVLSYGKAVSNTIPMTSSTDWVPIYNGQYWNVKYDYTTTGIHFNSGSNTDTTYNITVQNASDFIFGNINYSSSLSITPTFANHYEAWSEPSNNITRNIVHIGARTSSADSHNVKAYLTTFLGATPDTFSGSMQEYREWLEFIDQKTFDRHTFNPTSYVSALNPSSSYDTLVRQYTLGSNTIGFDLSTNGTIISSSHPNQKIKDFHGNLPFSTNATTIGFESPLNENRGNFVPVEETYFIEGVSSGMNSAKSQKIRFDDNKLVRTLSPTNTAERSKFDFASLDSNKLGLFYSFADQVNKDIFNQIGDVSLDDYIGDPDDEFKNEYPLLKQFSEKYWKKYTNKSDINSYIRIFSQFDFALFKQIKQLLAERIDEATGLLIEPHALERNKLVLTKKPSVETPMLDVFISDKEPTSSGIFESNLEANIDKIYTLRSSSIIPVRDMVINTRVTQSLILQDDIVVTGSRLSNIFTEVIPIYKGNKSGSIQEKNFSHAISKSLGIYSELQGKKASYMDDNFIMSDNPKFLGSRITGPGVNVSSNIVELNFKPVVEVFETNPNQIFYTNQPESPNDTNIINPGNIIIR